MTLSDTWSYSELMDHLRTERIFKIGTVELLESDARDCYENGKFLVTYSSIFQVCYSAAQRRYYGHKVFSKSTRGGGGFVKRGRFAALSADECNHLVGANVFLTA